VAIDDDDDLTVALGDRFACALLAVVLAGLPVYALWWASGHRGMLPAALAGGVVGIAALAAFARPQAMPAPFLQLVAAIRWAGRR
jgi:hypothetical protein